MRTMRSPPKEGGSTRLSQLPAAGIVAGNDWQIALGKRRCKAGFRTGPQKGLYGKGTTWGVVAQHAQPHRQAVSAATHLLQVRKAARVVVDPSPNSIGRARH